MEPSPETLSRIKNMTIIQSALPYLSEELDAQSHSIDVRAYTEIEHHTLTPELAYQYWLEKHSIKRIKSRLNQKVKLGQTAGLELEGATNA